MNVKELLIKQKIKEQNNQNYFAIGGALLLLGAFLGSLVPSVGELFGIIFGIILFGGLFVLIFFPGWMIYKKAGEPGWAILIPFYRTYIFGKIALGGKAGGWTFLIFPIILLLLYLIVIKSYYGYYYGYYYVIIINVIIIIMVCILLLFYILCYIRFARKFGKNIVFAIWFCVPTVHYFLLWHLALNKKCIYKKEE